jgi:probable phosphoglycerate mutase
LRDEPLDALYSSDLLRAYETAQAIGSPRGVPVVTDPRLREFAFGHWEGLTWDEIVAQEPGLAHAELTSAQNYAPAGGETFAQVRERVAAFFDDLAQRPFQNVAVVTHAGALHAALDVLAPGTQVLLLPAGITQIAMEDGVARLITLNDVRHLDPAG